MPVELVLFGLPSKRCSRSSAEGIGDDVDLGLLAWRTDHGYRWNILPSGVLFLFLLGGMEAKIDRPTDTSWAADGDDGRRQRRRPWRRYDWDGL